MPRNIVTYPLRSLSIEPIVRMSEEFFFVSSSKGMLDVNDSCEITVY